MKYNIILAYVIPIVICILLISAGWASFKNYIGEPPANKQPAELVCLAGYSFVSTDNKPKQILNELGGGVKCK